MRLSKYCLLAMLWPAMNSFAQSSPENITPLKIGDITPDLVLTNVVNYPASTIHLSDLKGKLVILDFWSSWCASCIDLFPKMHQLQKKFNDQMQVILVNTDKNEDIKKVKPIFEKLKTRTGHSVELPYSLLQTSLADYFPHRSVPHYVWINKNGKIVAITSQYEITQGNIQSVIDGKNISLPVKKDMPEFDREKPMFVDGNGGDGNTFLYRSVLTAGIPGTGNSSGVRRDEDHKITKLHSLNVPLMSLLKMAYRKQISYPKNQIIIEAKDPDRFSHSENSFSYENIYCYEITIPPSTIEETLSYMREDMSRMFQITVKNETRKMKCLILKSGKHSNKMITKGGKPEIETNATSLKKYMQNIPVFAFIAILNDLPATSVIPVINETGITENIDLIFSKDFREFDLADLKSFLKDTGFEIIEAERNINVAVITDK